LAAGSPTGLVRSWDWQSGQFLQNFAYAAPENLPFGRSSPVTAISYSRDGEYLVAGYENGSVNYFAIHQGNPIWKFANPPTVSDVAISADIRFIFVSNETPKISVWDISNRRQQKDSMAGPAGIRKLRLSPDGQLMLAGGTGQSVYLWDPNSQGLINSFANLGGRAIDFDFSFDNKYVAIGLATGDIKVFKTPALVDTLKSPELESTFKVYSGQIPDLAFAPNSSMIAAGNGQNSLQVMDSKSGARIFELKNEMNRINRLYFSGNGSWLATAHDDGIVRIWDVQKAQEIHRVEGYLPKGNPFSPDNRFLVFVHPTGKNKPDALEVLDLQKWETVASLLDYKPRAFVEFQGDARASKLLVMGDPHSARVWDVATWQEVNIHPGAIEGCGQYFTPQSALVTVISNAGILFTYNQNVQDMCAANPQGTILKYFFQDQNKMLFVLGNGKIWKGNSQSIDFFRIAQPEPYPTSDDIFLAGEQSGWFAYVSGTTVYIENLNGIPAGTKIAEQNDYQYQVALFPGKNLMALGSRYGSIHIWSMP
jgi:WD40 repeat protein